MTDRRPACTAGDIDPDDWFIEKDGKQYPDDELLTPEEKAEAVWHVPGEPYETLEERMAEAVAEAEAEQLKVMLRRRRHAKDACFRCPLRLECLRIALDQRIEHGTFGGYYPEERRQILKLIDERERREAESLLEE